MDEKNWKVRLKSIGFKKRIIPEVIIIDECIEIIRKYIVKNNYESNIHFDEIRNILHQKRIIFVKEYYEKNNIKKQLKDEWNNLYAEYLKSNEWKSKRENRLKIDKYKCRKCNSNKSLQVHHVFYDNVGDEQMSELITLCEKCHGNYHGRAL